MEPIYVPKSPHEKELQRALLQWKMPEKRRLIMEALHKAGRTDLIGYGPDCLLRPSRQGTGGGRENETPKPASASGARGRAGPKKGKPPSSRGGKGPRGRR